MAGNMSRNKGQRGEREAAALIMKWSAEVVDTLRDYGYDVEDVKVERNLNQTRVGSGGSYDLVGIEWLALEVKRQETLNVNAWWAQTVKQCGEDQEPLLMYRQNNQKWKFMTKIVYQGVPITVTMDEEQAARWFKTNKWTRLTCRGA